MPMSKLFEADGAEYGVQVGVSIVVGGLMPMSKSSEADGVVQVAAAAAAPAMMLMPKCLQALGD